jgi:hypothetical protein
MPSCGKMQMDTHKIKDASKSFVTKSGLHLHSLKDLYGQLSVMTEEEYRHHVTEQKNDFAAWVEHSHDDKFLAQKLRQAKTKEDAQKTVFMGMFQ